MCAAAKLGDEASTVALEVEEMHLTSTTGSVKTTCHYICMCPQTVFIYVVSRVSDSKQLIH